ncbi:MAG: diguanylate cyclase [Burkholderiales bacterium]
MPRLPERVRDRVPIGIAVLDGYYRVHSWNAWLAEKTAISEESALGKTLQDLFPHFNSPRLIWAIGQVITRRSPQVLSQALNQFVIPIRTAIRGRHGTSLMQQQAYVNPLAGDDGRVYAVLSILDVTESVSRSSALLEVAQKLQSDSNRDALTGLYNRRFLWEWLVQQLKLCNRYDHSLACLMLDIDHFKRVNDGHGHEGGDQVIKDFAQVVAAQLRDSDVLVRYGGEEFVVLIPHCGAECGIASAQRILAAVRGSKLGPLAPGEVTCSIGVACWSSDHPSTGEELLKRADKYLYEAKQGGRNAVVPQTVRAFKS